MKIFRNWNREKVWKVKSESRKKGNKSEGFTGNVKLGQMFCFWASDHANFDFCCPSKPPLIVK